MSASKYEKLDLRHLSIAVESKSHKDFLIGEAYYWCGIDIQDWIKGNHTENARNVDIGFEFACKAVEYTRECSKSLYSECCCLKGNYYCHKLDNENAKRMYRMGCDSNSSYIGLLNCWFLDTFGVYGPEEYRYLFENG
eukprot:287906_1